MNANLKIGLAWCAAVPVRARSQRPRTPISTCSRSSRSSRTPTAPCSSWSSSRSSTARTAGAGHYIRGIDSDGITARNYTFAIESARWRHRRKERPGRNAGIRGSRDHRAGLRGPEQLRQHRRRHGGLRGRRQYFVRDRPAPDRRDELADAGRIEGAESRAELRRQHRVGRPVERRRRPTTRGSGGRRPADRNRVGGSTSRTRATRSSRRGSPTMSNGRGWWLVMTALKTGAQYVSRQALPDARARVQLVHLRSSTPSSPPRPEPARSPSPTPTTAPSPTSSAEPSADQGHHSPGRSARCRRARTAR